MAKSESDQRPELPIDPKAELFFWGPAPMKFYYNSEFDGFMLSFPKIFPGEQWPLSILIAKGEMMVWINDFPELREEGKKSFLKHILEEKEKAKVFQAWLDDLKKVNEWEALIDSLELRKLSDSEFADQWGKMRTVLMSFWTNALMPELANYGGEKILENELKAFVKDEKTVASLMEILCAPERPSFYQVEEFELFNAKNLALHARKYFWLRNSYHSTEVLTEEFFARKKGEIKSDPKEEFDRRLKEVRRKKDEARKQYSLPDKIMRIAERIHECIEWQDDRKKNIWIYMHYKNLMLEEAVRILGIQKSDLLNFGTPEILGMLHGKMPDQKTIADRRIGFVALFEATRPGRYFGSDKALQCWELYMNGKIEDVQEIRGTVVSAAKPIQGKIRLVLDPKKVDHFERGEIMVAPMTTPEYIFAMKKAAAVVTDTGGLTSHAAIVSRELKIPCIVGTKIATRVLKDGDLIEIDTNKGIVRKIV